MLRTLNLHWLKSPCCQIKPAVCRPEPLLYLLLAIGEQCRIENKSGRLGCDRPSA